MENNVNNTAPAAEGKVNSMSWEDIDKSSIRNGFAGVDNKLRELGSAMQTLAKEAKGFDNTKGLVESLRDKDLTSSGWLSSFIAENSSSFPNAGGDESKRAARPDWYFLKTPEVRKQYDLIFEYMDDAVKLTAFFKPLVDILTRIPLKEVFRVLRVVSNMKSKGYGAEWYDTIDKIIASVNEVLGMGWNVFESKADAAERYYNENKQQIESPKVKEQYFKLRMDAYAKVVMERPAGKFLNYYDGVGRFKVHTEWVANMRVQDKYMQVIIGVTHWSDQIKSLLTACQNLLDSLMTSILLSTGAGRDLHQALKNAVVVIQFFLTCCDEELGKFKSGSKEGPYCFINVPPAAANATGHFGFSPSWGDSYSHGGTEYEDIPRKMLYAIMTQCREFAYVHGKVH